MRSAQRLSEAVKKPAILSVTDLRDGLEPLRANRQVFVQFCGDDDKCVQFATVKQLKGAFKELAYPQNTPAYLLRKERKQAFNAWPIIWQGVVGQKYILVAYIDPVRYGFKSRAKALLTIGPPTPMPIDRRKNGLWINRDPKSLQVRFDPIVDGDTRLAEGKVRKPLETVSARKLTFKYGHHWREVLQSYVQPAPRTKGQQQQFNVYTALPDKTQYDALLRHVFTKTVEEIVDAAYDAVTDLGSEMQEIFDNTPDSLQYTEVGMARQEAASSALGIGENKPEVPAPLTGLEVFRLPIAASSRGAQAHDAAQALEAVIEAAEALSKTEQKECKDFLDQLSQDAEAIEEIEFPGMFG